MQTAQSSLAYLKELKEPLIPIDLTEQMLSLTSNPEFNLIIEDMALDEKTLKHRLENFVSAMPSITRYTFLYLMRHLKRFTLELG
jgi:hypothetical protein